MMQRPLPPTPAASDEATRRAMQGNRRADTTPEVALRRLLRASGVRFHQDYARARGRVSRSKLGSSAHGTPSRRNHARTRGLEGNSVVSLKPIEKKGSA